MTAKQVFEAEQEQKTTAYLPKDDGMKHAFSGADVIVIPAGIPRTFPLG